MSFIGLGLDSLYKIQLTTPKYLVTESEPADRQRWHRQYLSNLETTCKELTKESVRKGIFNKLNAFLNTNYVLVGPKHDLVASFKLFLYNLSRSITTNTCRAQYCSCSDCTEVTYRWNPSSNPCDPRLRVDQETQQQQRQDDTPWACITTRQIPDNPLRLLYWWLWCWDIRNKGGTRLCGKCSVNITIYHVSRAVKYGASLVLKLLCRLSRDKLDL
jgi:hypothetical protein